MRSANRFGIVVYTATGRELAYIPTETLPTNCCFGSGTEANVLYVHSRRRPVPHPDERRRPPPGHRPLAKGGWVPLFDGQSAKGWTPRGRADRLEAVNGELHLFSTVNVWVVSDVQMADFEVEAEVNSPSKPPQKTTISTPGWGFGCSVKPEKPKGYQCEVERESAGKNGRRLRHRAGRLAVPEGRKANRCDEAKKQGAVPRRQVEQIPRSCRRAADSNMDQWPADFRP